MWTIAARSRPVGEAGALGLTDSMPSGRLPQSDATGGTL
jgi:hypothetical protein